MIRFAELLDAGGTGTELPTPWQRFSDRLPGLATALKRQGVSGDTQVLAVFTPGRIEVLGKHTDYGGGRSLVVGTEQGILLLAAASDDDRMFLHDISRDQSTEFRIGPDLEVADPHWPLYPKTVARRLARDFSSKLQGAVCAFDSDLPAAAGLSSSSVLVVAVFLTLARLNRLYDLPEFRREIHSQKDLAGFLGAIENGRGFGSFSSDLGVGTAGGDQDQTAILCSKAGYLQQFSYLPTRLERQIEMPDGMAFAVGTSGVRAKKTGSARAQYNRASGLLTCVLEVWNHSTGRNDPSLGAVLEQGTDTAEKLEEILTTHRDAAFTSEELLIRLRHFRAETEEIVPAAGDALEGRDLAGFGAVVDRSQELVDKLLGNQIPETIFLAREARHLSAVAASAFGAGFGGAVWALVRQDNVEGFLEHWRESYLAQHPEHAESSEFFWTAAGDGAVEL